MGFFKNLFKRKKSIRYTKAFHRSHVSLDSVLDAFQRQNTFDSSVIEALEDTLIMADVGIETTDYIVEKMIQYHQTEPIKNKEKLLDGLSQVMDSILDVYPIDLSKPTAIFMVGVNGAGKTTTIGKLAHQFQSSHSVKIIAADTFRAAAIEQLHSWAERSNASFYTQASKDPSAVIYDGLQEAKRDGSDVILIDTAGRLQSKDHLMAQLSKMRRVINKAYEGIQVMTLLVIDGTTGQNGLSQAKIFHEATDVNGVVITKLDGTTKGGIVLAIAQTLRLPMAYIGLGEGIEDLVAFDPVQYMMQLIDAESVIHDDH